MIDRDRLRLQEAIALLIDGTVLQKIDRHNADGFVAAVVTVSNAARLVASETTLIIWWCENHRQSGDEVGCLGVHMRGTPCLMVERALLAYQTGDIE